METLTQFENYASEIGGRLTETLNKENIGEMKDSLKGMMTELTDRLREEPVQAVTAGVALGFFIGKMWKAQGSDLPKQIGKGIGALIASSLLERVSSAHPNAKFGKGTESETSDLRH